jgi:trk system potassium uptake protein
LDGVRASGPWRSGDRFRHPARVIAGGFGAAVLVGTGLLLLPVATADGERADIIAALFTATSAVCVAGLAIVDTGGHWSAFGEIVIMLLIQAGGLGIMTMATLFAVLLSGRLGVRARLLAQAETKALGLADIRRLIRKIVVFALISEAIAAVILTTRFALAYDMPFGRAVYHGVFHAVSAFNSGGLALYPDSLSRYVSDPWISLTISLSVLLGGFGFPVVFELARSWRRPRSWSIMTRITVWVSLVLIGLTTAIFVVAEHANPATLGPLSGAAKLHAGFFAAVMPRSGGFNSIDIGSMRPESLFVTDILMFIGGGSASTAGGIKVTTFGLLGMVIWAEMRGETRVNVGRRRVPETNQRQALAIALLGIAVVTLGTFVLLSLTHHSLDRVLFEAVSAFGTVGLSTGITAELPPVGHLVIVVLMFVGRIGPLTVASALALRERSRRFELPEERTIVG